MGNIKKSEVVNSETVKLLYKLNKSSYQHLKDNSNNNYSYLFNIGDIMGDDDNSINREEFLIKAKTAKLTLESVSENAYKFFKKIKLKIDKYKKIELISQIVTALGGSALLITLLKEFEDNSSIHFILQITGAIIATAGSLFSVFLNRGLGAWSFNRRNRIEDYDVLVESKLESEKLLRDLIPKIEVFQSIEDLTQIKEIINKTEVLSKKVGIIIADYN